MDAEQFVIRSNAEESRSLEENLRKFYKLSETPRISKEVFVSRASYNRFFFSKMRERTPFESNKSFNDYKSEAKSGSLEIIRIKCTFNFPSGRTISLLETLNEPNGLTQSVELTDSDGTLLTFPYYYQAEAEVVERFLQEGVKIGS